MITVIIPARLQSQRLPGKPLLNVNGKPLLWYAWRSAAEWVGEENVHVATPNAPIFSRCFALGISCVLTGDEHPNGTSRVLEAAAELGSDSYSSEDVLVNLQADEPEITPAMLGAAYELLTDHPSLVVSTLSRDLTDGEIGDRNVVKVIRWGWKAAYFSRARLGGAEAHLGLYMFRCSHVDALRGAPQNIQGKEEGLEQLRWMGYGLPIGIARVDGQPCGVNTLREYREFAERATRN